MKLIRKILGEIFPPFSELAVFVMTLSLIILFIVDANFRTSFGNWYMDFMASGEKDIGDIWAKFVLHFLFVAMIVLSLLLPFTKADFRHICVIITWVHLGIIAAFNGQQFVTEPISLHFYALLFSISWLFINVFRARYDDIDTVISPDHAHGVHAIIAGVVCTVVIVFLVKISDKSWLLAYATAFFGSVYVVRFVQPIIVSGRKRRAD